MDLSSSADVSNLARVPDFQALEGGLGRNLLVTVSKLVFSSLYLAIYFMRR